MPLANAPTPLAGILAARIRGDGPIPFAEYMHECLYHSEHGYYRSAYAARQHRDYYTSVDVHPVFARLLARQLAEMWALLEKPEEFFVLEMGAGTGRLAAEILGFSARMLPEFSAAIRYFPIEQDGPRREQLAKTLAKMAALGQVFLRDSPAGISRGCVLSNEFFDALPVHRVICAHGELREIYVALDGGRFTERLAPPSKPELAGYFAAQKIRLLEGQHAEAGLRAAEILAGLGEALKQGFVLTIDYGHEARELYNERHMRGTLLAYRGHRASEDYYSAPGLQDLTAHVNFTALEMAGRRAGLERTGLVSQTSFLMALGKGNDFADLYDPGQSETGRVRARLLLKNLIYPEGMGETFRVLVQHKGLESPRLTGLQPL